MKNKSLKSNIFFYYLITVLIILISLITLSIYTIFKLNNRTFTISVILILLFLIVIIIYSIIKINRLLDPINELDRYINDLNKFKYLKNNNYYNTKTYNTLFEHLYELSSNLNQIKDSYDNQNKIISEIENNKKFVELEEKDLIYSISHELKTPLAVIEAQAYALLDKIYEGEEADQTLEKIISECKVSVSLIQDVLNVFKLNRADFTKSFETFDLKDILTDKLNSFKDIIEKHEHTLVTDITSSVITSDKTQIVLALSNVINNAITNSPKNSTIKISLKDTQTEFQIEVTNSNAYIPDEKLETIFNPFVKVDISHKKKDSTGNGLGLYIVKQILTKLNYDYGILNTSEGVKFFIVGKKNI